MRMLREVSWDQIPRSIAMSNTILTEAASDHVVWSGLSMVSCVSLLIPIWRIWSMPLRDDADHLLERDTITVFIFNNDAERRQVLLPVCKAVEPAFWNDMQPKAPTCG